MQIPITLLVGLLLAAIFTTIYLYIANRTLLSEAKTHKDEALRLQSDNSQLHSQNLSLEDQLSELKIDIASLETEHRLLNERLQNQMEDTERSQQRFEILANKVLDEKSQKMQSDHQKSMTMMLDPLKERIQNFEQKIEQNTKEDIARHASLKEQIYTLSQLNERMTLETMNLTKALKGDNKIQGNWGELILESILKKSGLERDREYYVQESIRSQDGKRLQPDMLIKTPDNKVYVIDSKVSLTAYERYVNSEDPESAAAALKAHTLSIKSHIDGLASKRYHELYQIESPDFVLMFIPIETAFAAAVKLDLNIYQYAFDKHVVIVTPSTLLATLKTIETMWRNDRQQKYALDIAIQAGRMYDKFHAFTEDMSKIENRLHQLQSSYDDAMNKLSTGKGNLIQRAEKIKALGAKANKQIQSIDKV